MGAANRSGYQRGFQASPAFWMHSIENHIMPHFTTGCSKQHKTVVVGIYSCCRYTLDPVKHNQAWIVFRERDIASAAPESECRILS